MHIVAMAGEDTQHTSCPAAELVLVHIAGGLCDAALEVAAQGVQLLTVAARHFAKLLQLLGNTPDLAAGSGGSGGVQWRHW